MNRIYSVVSYVLSLFIIGISNHLNANIPSWMIEQISNDLAPFQKEGITEEILDNFMAQPTDQMGLYRFKIINNIVHTEPKTIQKTLTARATIVQNRLQELAKTHSLPDLDFICCVNDY